MISTRIGLRSYWNRLVNWLDRSLTEPDDTDSIRVRKITVGLLSLAIIPASFAWTISFLPLDLNPATNVLNAIISLMYVAGAIFLFRTKNFKVYVNLLALVSLTF